MTRPRPQPLRSGSNDRWLRERRAQVAWLILLALAAVLFAVFRAGWRNVLIPGWWRFW